MEFRAGGRNLGDPSANRVAEGCMQRRKLFAVLAVTLLEAPNCLAEQKPRRIILEVDGLV
jgi:hypothetical protein